MNMNTAGYIMSFDNTNGLDPKVVAKLNNNFWYLANMFTDPEIVAVSSVNAPDPRTNETLWYKTDTGDLYIWSLFTPIDPDTLEQQDPEWRWTKIDLNLVELVDTAPANSVRDTNALIKYHVTSNGAMPYFWVDNGNEPQAGWYSFLDLVTGWVTYLLGTQDIVDIIADIAQDVIDNQ